MPDDGPGLKAELAAQLIEDQAACQGDFMELCKARAANWCDPQAGQFAIAYALLGLGQMFAPALIANPDLTDG